MTCLDLHAKAMFGNLTPIGKGINVPQNWYILLVMPHSGLYCLLLVYNDEFKVPKLFLLGISQNIHICIGKSCLPLPPQVGGVNFQRIFLGHELN